MQVVQLRSSLPTIQGHKPRFRATKVVFFLKNRSDLRAAGAERGRLSGLRCLCLKPSQLRSAIALGEAASFRHGSRLSPPLQSLGSAWPRSGPSARAGMEPKPPVLAPGSVEAAGCRAAFAGQENHSWYGRGLQSAAPAWRRSGCWALVFGGIVPPRLGDTPWGWGTAGDGG